MDGALRYDGPTVGIARDGGRAGVAFAARVVAVQLVLLILLQKVAFSVGPGEIALALPVLLGGMVLLGLSGGLLFSPARLLAAVALVMAATLSALLCGRAFSAGALLLFLAVYIPMLIVVPVDDAGYRWIMNVFIFVMMMFATLVPIEWIFNLTIGHGFWPSLDTVIPTALQYSNFNYLQPLYYGSSFIKPNGIFFLEVSYLSQFLAIALICEARLFRRFVPLLILTTGLLLTFAGTGLIVLALTLPFMLARLDRRLLLAGLALSGLLIAGGIATGWLDTISKRSIEFTTPGTSGYERYTASLVQVAKSLDDPNAIVTGTGPGNVPTQNINSLPVTKLITEYGLLTAIAFYILFCVALFGGTRNLPLAVGLFFFFNLGGGSLSMPLCVLLCVLLATAVPRIAESGMVSGRGALAAAQSRSSGWVPNR